MQELNILTYLQKRLEEGFFHHPWHLAWREQDPYAVLTFQVELDNESGLTIEDNYQQSSDHNAVFYELKILFYDSNLLEINSETYLATIDIDAMKGIRVGELSAIISYLKELTSQVRANWYDFLNSDLKEPFMVEWNDKRFNEIKASMVESNQLTNQRLYFPEKQ